MTDLALVEAWDSLGGGFEVQDRLVIARPYRFVRNPMAVAGIVQGLAVGWYLGELHCDGLFAGWCRAVAHRGASGRRIGPEFAIR